MAAIIPHLEVPSDITPLERAYDICAGSINGASLGEDLPSCPSPNAVLADAHAGLLGMVYVREAVFQSLMTKQFVVRPGDIKGKDTRNVYLVLDQPIGPGPAWNPATNPNVQQYQLLSWTSKMNTPSWSLPAGSPQIGGACPGAVAGQSIVPESALRAAARHVNRGLGRSSETPVNLAQCICEFCVTGDTKVLVEGRGWIPIEELVGANVRVWSGIGWRDTHAVFRGVKPTVQLTTSWGHTIRATADHKILTVDRGMVPIEELKEGDRLVFQPPEEGRWPTVAPIVGYTPSGHHNEIDYENMPREWTFQVGLFAGYVLGDGNIYGGKHPTVSLVASEADRDDLERLRNVVNRWCETDASVTVREHAPNGFTSKLTRSAHLAFRVKAIAQLLTAIGLDKSVPPEARRVPNTLWTATQEGVRGFLCGLFSTDGSVSLSSSKFELSLASVSETLLRDVQLLLMSFGIRSTICAYETSNRRRVVQGYRPLYKLSISSIGHVRLFADRIGFWNARKHAKLLEGLEQNADVTTQQKYPKVEAITWLDEEEAVYDLINVGEEHHFVANGITVSNCYATGGQYSTGQVQFAQLLRFLWARQAINFPAQAPDGSMSTAFVETMVYAINSADYKLGGGTVKGEGAEATQDLPPEPSGRRFFRIHDSGDFFEEEYLRQWKAVADRLPDITFWAPSRIWATSWGTDAVNRYNRDQRNLIIRPSAYEVNEHGPENLGPGWAGPTTVIAVQQNLGMTPEREQYVYDRAARFPPKMTGPDPRYTWNCQAYATEDQKHTCRKAVAPPGFGGPDGKGCRACWVATDEIVNYSLH
jgi:intein/homing endonuclease